MNEILNEPKDKLRGEIWAKKTTRLLLVVFFWLNQNLVGFNNSLGDNRVSLVNLDKINTL